MTRSMAMRALNLGSDKYHSLQSEAEVVNLGLLSREFYVYGTLSRTTGRAIYLRKSLH